MQVICLSLLMDSEGLLELARSTLEFGTPAGV